MNHDPSYNYREFKATIAISSAVTVGQALNIASHLAMAAGYRMDASAMGKLVLHDADGNAHHGILKYPIIITKAKPTKLRNFIEQAREVPNLLHIEFPKEMIDTGHDDELVDALMKNTASSIEYLGCLIFGPTDVVNKLTSKFSLWRD